ACSPSIPSTSRPVGPGFASPVAAPAPPPAAPPPTSPPPRPARKKPSSAPPCCAAAPTFTSAPATPARPSRASTPPASLAPPISPPCTPRPASMTSAAPRPTSPTPPICRPSSRATSAILPTGQALSRLNAALVACPGYLPGLHAKACLLEQRGAATDLTLASDLLTQLAGNLGDPAHQHALFIRAGLLAVRAGDPARAWRVLA